MITAVGSTLTELKTVASTHEDATGVIAIITDGMENSSRHYNWKNVANQISQVNGIVDKFISEKFVIPTELGYSVTQLGSILLAKNLRDFSNLYRKAVRVIVYRGKNKIDTVREQSFEQGYAVQFVQMLDWINGQLPANEEIGRALRKDVRMYPEKAIREIVANMIIHQNQLNIVFRISVLL